MDSLLPILTALKHRWMYGDTTTSQAYGRNFLRISFATLPDWCHSEAIRVLSNEIREGLVVAFSE
ncbi:hypothetical protein GALMADRAFT_241733 [Galerina marginata CBS 339.88]|uniref:Uncharacterized protein n=1 Tax=Galerina marginata (strain CBS 339.88) TaxID=685588 RepID=A0A067TQB8_GALM3|nr:hypothetical protein GALMADRAFT_241733 [Galerina marginata CBS 339.88]